MLSCQGRRDHLLEIFLDFFVAGTVVMEEVSVLEGRRTALCS